MIVEAGQIHVAIVPELAEAAFNPVENATVHVPSVRPGAAGQRAVVEIYRSVGGLPQRALLGGWFEASPGQHLSIVSGLTGSEMNGGARNCPGHFGRDLVRGIPSEFASAVLIGCLQQHLPAGRMLIDRGAFDPVESSTVAFILATRVLAEVVQAASFDDVGPRTAALLARLEAR